MTDQIWKNKLKEGFSTWKDLASFLNLPLKYIEYHKDTNFPMRVPISFAKLMLFTYINIISQLEIFENCTKVIVIISGCTMSMKFSTLYI